ncbi:hypothetical protein HPP92_028253 [Vanilla planifolia]|uniref:Uncharacterized protein n=1 Tax=Vanilla planifolia TaxID=51239 RepID=A0A835P6T7_VANPL|nr:hypothetical protein HPP92_028253 [Vanilla planifolia]
MELHPTLNESETAGGDSFLTFQQAIQRLQGDWPMLIDPCVDWRFAIQCQRQLLSTVHCSLLNSQSGISLEGLISINYKLAISKQLVHNEGGQLKSS